MVAVGADLHVARQRPVRQVAPRLLPPGLTWGDHGRGTARRRTSSPVLADREAGGAEQARPSTFLLLPVRGFTL